MTKENAIELLNAIRKIIMRNNSWLENTHEPINEAFDMAIEALKESEQKTGRWVLNEKESEKHIEKIYNCSACMNFEAWGETELYKYCPNCGAKMVGVIE